MNKIKTTILLSSATLLFTACGGGGGSSAPVDTVNTNKYDLRTFIDTRSFSVDGAGTVITSGGTLDLTGTYQTEYLGTTIAPTGETVHEHDVTTILSVENVTVSASVNSLTYMGYIVYTDNTTSGLVCKTTLTSNNITPVPTDAQVGYISDVIPLQCDDGTYATIVVKLNDAGGGNAEIAIISNTYTSQGGTLQSTETSKVVVTPTMSIADIELSGSDLKEDYSYTLSSTSITQ